MNKFARTLLPFFFVALLPSQGMASQNNQDGMIDDQYRDNGDGTITDTTTNLTWMRCLLGQQWTGSTCAGKPAEYTFKEATHAAVGFSYAGKSDWRMPTIEELYSLVDCDSGQKVVFSRDRGGICRPPYQSPAINLDVFPKTPNSGVWSVSPRAEFPDASWSVGFYNGNAGGANHSFEYLVRLVRGGE